MEHMAIYKWNIKLELRKPSEPEGNLLSAFRSLVSALHLTRESVHRFQLVEQNLTT